MNICWRKWANETHSGHLRPKWEAGYGEAEILASDLGKLFRPLTGLLQLSNHMIQKSPNWRANDALGQVKQSHQIWIFFVSHVLVRHLLSSLAIFVPRDCSVAKGPLVDEDDDNYAEDGNHVVVVVIIIIGVIIVFIVIITVKMAFALQVEFVTRFVSKWYRVFFIFKALFVVRTSGRWKKPPWWSRWIVQLCIFFRWWSLVTYITANSSLPIISELTIQEHTKNTFSCLDTSNTWAGLFESRLTLTQD